MKSKDNPTRLPPWTLTQLWEELQNDLKLCTTKTEELNCKVIGYKEIRDLAFTLDRLLTPMEELVLSYAK